MIDRFSIFGLGLLGGSLALALKKAYPSSQIFAWGRKPERLRRAQDLGLIDSWSSELDQLPQDSRGVFIATPVETIAGLALEILPRVSETCFVTDVGSTKREIVRAILDSGLSKGRFIGSHPMAGSEKTGFEHSSQDLFVGARVVLTPTPESDPSLLSRLSQVWQDLGARVVQTSPQKHDELVGLTSHLAHLLSYAYAASLEAGQALHGDFQGIWGNGLRDILRLSASDSALWSEIFLANREALLAGLDLYERQLKILRDSIKSEKPEILSQRLRASQSWTEELCENDQSSRLMARREPEKAQSRGKLPPF